MWRSLFSIVSPGGAKARLSILIFHRVLPAPDPLFPGQADAREFDRICGWVARWFRVLPLDEAVARLRRQDLPSRSLAITFDDGYADNHDVALPVLQRHGLNATFFVATGFLDGGRMWNDTVVEAIRATTLPLLDLSDLGVPGLGAVALRDLAQRRAAIEAVLGALKYRSHAERLQLAQAIAERSGAALPDDLMMSSAQVRALHRAGMRIGAHTVSHPILAALDRDEARREIDQSRQVLERITGEAVTLFAYPNGVPGKDFGDETAALIRELGFGSACSTAWGASHVHSDPYRLPRFTPWDRTRTRFALRMVANLRHGRDAA